MDYLSWAEYARRWGGAWGNYKYFKYIKWPGAPAYDSTPIVVSKPTPRYEPDPGQYRVSYSRALYVKDEWDINSRMHGDDVLYIQVCLHYLGYDIGYDGWFGPNTRAAVKAFQQNYGLEADGACGPATWPAIEQAVANNPPPNPIVAPTEAYIDINGSKFDAGETVSFSFRGNNDAQFTIGIDKGDTRVITEVCSSYSTSTLEPGDYSAYVTAWNSAGHVDSGRVYFTVYANPNFEPKATVTDNNHTYLLYDDLMTWTEAKAKCEEFGGHLVTITSAHEQEVVNGMLDKGIRDYYWIGASDTETEGTFKWVTGEAFSYSNWDDGQPDNYQDEDYAHLWSGGKWNDAQAIQAGFILEKEPSTYTVTYNANGGSGAPSAQTKTHGKNLTLSGTQPTRSGYTFMGWAENASATTAQYQAGASFTDNKNVTLYAVWKQVTLSSVAIKKMPTKKTYTVGEKFDPTGMIVKLTYSDGSTKEITSGYTYTPTGTMNTVGQQTIAVAYQGKGTGFKVTVEPSLNSISVKSKPNKLTYTVGETLDTSGLKLTASYSDGTTKEITSGFTCTPTKLSSKGQQLITVKYGNVSTSFYVTVNGVTVKQIRVTQNPTKTTYVTGNTLNTSGMKVTVTYSDGSTKVITSGFTCTPTKLETVGTQWITVKYGGTATAFPVKVEQRAQSVRVITKPSKTTYVVGQSFNPAGMKVRATYPDGTTKDVTSGFTCTPAKLETVGNQWITVVYAGQSTAFSVKVEPKAKTLRISQQPAKKTYTVGDVLNTSGMKLTATYDDGTTKEVTSGFVCSPAVLNTEGNQWITVIYGGQSTAYSVKVTKAVSSVTIAKKPTKQTYTVGDTFAPAGMKLKVTYADNTTEEITSGYTYTPTGKLNTEGQQKIVVSYGGKSTGFYVTVNKPSGNTVTGVAIAKLPTKKTYKRGESFDPAGMTVKVTYADGTTSVIAGGYTYTPGAPLTTAGQQVITVSYGGKSTGFKVTVE